MCTHEHLEGTTINCFSLLILVKLCLPHANLGTFVNSTLVSPFWTVLGKEQRTWQCLPALCLLQFTCFSFPCFSLNLLWSSVATVWPLCSCGSQLSSLISIVSQFHSLSTHPTRINHLLLIGVKVWRTDFSPWKPLSFQCAITEKINRIPAS